jgi:ABC-2 type transport system ATP-binding protein
MQHVIIAKDLSKSFSSFKAVDSVNLAVGKGELFGLLGPNGSGKTTIIRMLTGQARPSSGTAEVLGIDASKEPIRVRELVGIIPEQESPPSFLTAEEYLHFVGKIRKIKDARKPIAYWFDLLKFDEQKDILCKDLSRGTRQKLMFAQAFLHEPKVAFIDEPLINLDPVIQRDVKDYLLRYVKEGNTVFMSTHVLEIAEEICTRIGILYRGRLLYEGAVKKNLEAFFLKTVKNA